MFEYQRDYFERLRGQHLKVILNIVLFSLALGAGFFLVGGVSAVVVGGSAFAAFDSANSGALAVIGIIFGILLILLFAIFVLIPLNFSYYNYYFLAYEEKFSKFTHGLFPFQKGRYLKSLGLAIVLILLGFLVNGFINLVTGPIFYGGGLGTIDPNSIESFESNASNSIGALFLGLIGILVSILLNLIVQGLVVNSWFRHLERPENTFGDKISTGFNIVFKNFKQFLKLVVSIFLLIFALILIIGISFFIAAAIIAAVNSTAVSVIVGGIAAAVVIISSIFISYIGYGGFASFYEMNKFEPKYTEETVEYVEA